MRLAGLGRVGLSWAGLGKVGLGWGEVGWGELEYLSRWLRSRTIGRAAQLTPTPELFCVICWLIAWGLRVAVECLGLF